MLIIGHRGSQGTHPENTLPSLRAAIEADADMIEIDVRLTKDSIPILYHNRRLFGSRKRELAFLGRYTLAELRERTSKSEYPITTLEDALGECFGKVFLNIEIKETAAVAPTLAVVSQFAKRRVDWDSILFSSFKPLALRRIRRLIPHATLGMLHYRNPLAFVGWHRLLNLSAVGFHRLYISTIALEIARRLDLFTYAYTVNRRVAAEKLADQGVDGVVTDYPGRMRAELERRAKK